MDLQEFERAAKRRGHARERTRGDGGFALLEDTKAWCRSRNPWVRLPFMLYGVHFIMLSAISLKTEEPRTIFSRLFSFFDFGFDWLNLGIHEIGHIVFGPFGMFVSILGGSLLQCLVPLLSTIVFYRQRDYFAISFCFLWFGANLMDVAVYVADARTLQLNLVSPFGGGEIIHDWNWLLSQLGMLRADSAIAFAMRSVGFVSMTLFLVSGGWMLSWMFRSDERPECSDID